MGQSAMIYVRTKSGNPPSGHSCFWEECFLPSGATHEVDVPYRFYGKGYERGPWPLICAVLLDLLGNKDVESVWYCSDSGNNTNERLVTLDLIAELNAHWREVGNAGWAGY